MAFVESDYGARTDYRGLEVHGMDGSRGFHDLGIGNVIVPMVTLLMVLRVLIEVVLTWLVVTLAVVWLVIVVVV